MEVTVLQGDEKRLTLLVKDVPVEVLNALRRTLLARLPAFAIDEVDFYENNSVMFNEYLANRLGLVPLTFEETSSDDVKVSLSLDAEAVDDSRVVHSREMVSSDAAVKVFAQNIPVMKLAKGQKLRFEATAVKGIPAQHAKFQSAFATYADLEDFKLALKCKKCSAAMLPRMPVLAEKIPASKAPDECLLCFDCEEQLKSRKPSGQVVFYVESYNNLSPLQHLKRAVEIIDESLAKTAKELKE